MILGIDCMDNAPRIIFETRILEQLNGYAGHYPALDGTMRVLAVLGVLPLAAAAILIACCSSEAWRRRGGWITLVSVVPASVIIWQMEFIFRRTSPFLNHPIHLLLCCPDGLSFPSFELAAAAALAFGLFAYGGAMRWVWFPYIILMGVARVYCGIEYPLDQVWAAMVGTLSGLACVVILNPRHVLTRDEGWPIGAVGTLLVAAAIFLSAHTPAIRVAPKQSTYGSTAPLVNAEEKNITKGWTPAVEHVVADSLVKLPLPGRIRKVQVGVSEYESVAGVKFDAGTDTKPMPRPLLEKESLAIVRTTLAVAPKVNEVDVFAVTRSKRQGKQVLRVVYSVAAQRQYAGFLFSKQASQLTPGQALSKFGLIYRYPTREAME